MLDSFVEDIARLVDHIPGPTAIKDKYMKFIYCNSEFEQITGISPSKNIKGLTDHDLSNGFALHADLYREHDMYVLNRNAPVTALSVIQMANGRIKTHLINRKPVAYRSASPNYIIVNILDISAMNLHLFGKDISNITQNDATGRGDNKSIKYCSAEEKSNLAMTRREREILYHLLRGGTARHIAGILEISHRTVEQYIGILKDKFLADTKSDLIQKALHLGYFYLVPQYAA